MENEFKGDLKIKECYYSNPILKIVDENKKVFAIVPMRDSSMHRWGYEMQNAKLISKAPEMLELLNELSENLELQLSRLGCCGQGDGKGRNADNDSYGGSDLLIRAKQLIEKVKT